MIPKTEVDTTIEELHRTRERLAAKFNGNIRAILDDARRRQAAIQDKCCEAEISQLRCGVNREGASRDDQSARAGVNAVDREISSAMGNSEIPGRAIKKNVVCYTWHRAGTPIAGYVPKSVLIDGPRNHCQ